jgi:hypothetical protein
MYQDPPVQIIITPIQSKIKSVVGDNKRFIIYELLIINGSDKPVQLSSINIQGYNNNKKVLDLNINNLTDYYSTLSNINKNIKDSTLLQPNIAGMLFFEIDIKKSITRIENILNVGQLIKSNSIFIESNPIIINHPLKGKKWMVVNGFPNDGSHRRAKFILNGNIQFPERYGIDIMKYANVNNKYNLFNGDPYKNESYFAYGQPIYAVGDGIVYGIMDGIKDNIPGSGPSNPNSKTISGNYIILKLKNNYAFYAHLIPGSLNVKVGDKVYAGDKIARLGNTGNSSMPHLHFHISTKPMPIGDGKDPISINAQGLPWELNKFTLYDYIPEGKSKIDNVPLSVTITNKQNITNQILMYKNLIDFI